MTGFLRGKMIKGKQAEKYQAQEDKNKPAQEIPLEILKKMSLDTTQQEVEDKSKYTHLIALHDEQKVNFYTEWINQDEVHRANKILLLSDWASKIFGNTSGVTEGTRFMKIHLNEHMLHMTSHKRKRAHESVFAVRNDIDVVANSKTIGKAFGIGR